VRARLVAMTCAIAWAYAGVAAVIFHIPSLIGIAVWGFVCALFCTASLEEPFEDASSESTTEQGTP
jgi:hypothetical protein